MDPTPATLTISCDDCVAQGTDQCQDCLVTFLLDRPEHGAVVVDVAEYRAMRMLADGGLVPRLKHRRRTG